MENILYDIWLNTLDSIGPYLIRNLLEYFSTAENIYHANFNELTQVSMIGEKKAEIIFKTKELENAKTLVDYCSKQNILIVPCSSALYPPILHQYKKSPTILYARGNLEPLAYMNSATIVGARRCSDYGKEATATLAHHLSSQNIAIISGLAKGIDSYAHTATIKSGGYTVAILGTGPERCYPREHKELMNKIIETGAVISQFPPMSEAPKQNFIKRNKLIAMLSNQIFIMQATKTSGSVYTAQCGFEYHKEVFALPGSIYDPLSEGSNNLIAKGAKIYLPTLQSAAPTFSPTTSCSHPLGQSVLELLTNSPLPIEDISNHLQLEHNYLQEILFTLELENHIQCISGIVKLINFV